MSARIPGEPNTFLINNYGEMFDEITASSLVKMDMDGNVLGEGGRFNNAGFTIHSGVYKARPDAMCVMHTHTRAGAGVSMLPNGLRPISQDALQVYDDVAYHEYGVPASPEECEALGRTCKQGSHVVLLNHGLLTLGPTIHGTFFRTYCLERACELEDGRAEWDGTGAHGRSQGDQLPLLSALPRSHPLDREGVGKGVGPPSRRAVRAVAPHTRLSSRWFPHREFACSRPAPMVSLVSRDNQDGGRIASREMLPWADPLPRLIFIGGGGDVVDQHYDTETSWWLRWQPEGMRTDPGRIRRCEWLASQARDASAPRRAGQSAVRPSAREIPL